MQSSLRRHGYQLLALLTIATRQAPKCAIRDVDADHLGDLRLAAAGGDGVRWGLAGRGDAGDAGSSSNVVNGQCGVPRVRLGSGIRHAAPIASGCVMRMLV